MVEYDKSRSVISSDSYYGMTIEKSDIESSVSKKVNNDIRIRDHPRVDVYNLRVGNIVRLHFESSGWNKTLYRVDEIVHSAERDTEHYGPTVEKKRICVLFEPFDSRANYTRMDFVIDSNGDVRTSFSGYSYGYMNKNLKESIIDKIQSSTNPESGSYDRDTTKTSKIRARIIPDSVLYKHYDVEVENPSIFTLVNL